MAYMYLTEPHEGVVDTSVMLDPDAEDPETMHSLVLDFDRDGRLVGIEVFRPRHVLRSDLLKDGRRA
jgi:uncharacterized protein YuzE